MGGRRESRDTGQDPAWGIRVRDDRGWEPGGEKGRGSSGCVLGGKLAGLGRAPAGTRLLSGLGGGQHGAGHKAGSQCLLEVELSTGWVGEEL